MLHSDIQYGAARRQLSSYTCIRRTVLRMMEEFELRDTHLIEYIDWRIEKLEHEIARYRDTVYSGVQMTAATDLLAVIAKAPQLINEARLVRGWTLSHLATLADIHISQLCRYEREGYRRMPYSKLLRLCQALTASETAHGKETQSIS